MLVTIAGENRVQVIQDGQSSLFEMALPELSRDGELGFQESEKTLGGTQLGLLPGLILAERPAVAHPGYAVPELPILTTTKRFFLKTHIQRVFETERLPISTSDLLDCVGSTIGIDDRVFAAGFRETTEITRREEEIFTRDVQMDTVFAQLSDEDIARRSQRVLFEPEYLDPRELYDVLLGRLRTECRVRGWVKTDEELQRAMNLILVTFPSLLRRATKQCGARYAEVEAASPVPEYLEYSLQSQSSRLNGYGVVPPDLTRDEREFVNLLDSDLSGIVEWWLRNEPRKPQSVAVVLPSGAQYFPDFIVKVKGRTTGGGILLVEIKGDHLLNSNLTLDKAISEHRIYKRPMMLLWENRSRFMTIRQNDRSDKNEVDMVFRPDLMISH